jgi:hypothetical protein
VLQTAQVLGVGDHARRQPFLVANAPLTHELYLGVELLLRAFKVADLGLGLDPLPVEFTSLGIQLFDSGELGQ